MGPIFQPYGKNKVTLRRPNLAKEPDDKLYIHIRHILTQYLDTSCIFVSILEVDVGFGYVSSEKENNWLLLNTFEA